MIYDSAFQRDYDALTKTATEAERRVMDRRGNLLDCWKRLFEAALFGGKSATQAGEIANAGLRMMTSEDLYKLICELTPMPEGSQLK